jgi:aryl carrier-like protein
MIPARILVLDHFPLTTNAKVDRRALLTLAQNTHQPPTTPTTTPTDTPTTDTQRRIATLWTETLGLERIGVHDNFFDLGGDSRTLVALTERLRRSIKADLRVVDVMGHPSVAELSRLLDAGSGSSTLATRASRRAQERRRRR